MSVLLYVTSDGFAASVPGTGVGPVYASADCSGPPRIREDEPQGSRVLLPVANVIGTLAYYAEGPISTTPFNSTEAAVANPADCVGMLTPRGSCCAADVESVPTAAAAVLDLAALGLTPPFHVEGP